MVLASRGWLPLDGGDSPLHSTGSVHDDDIIVVDHGPCPEPASLGSMAPTHHHQLSQGCSIDLFTPTLASPQNKDKLL